MYNTVCRYPELEGKIIAKFGTRGKYAAALGITLTTLGCKLNGKSKWKEKEMLASCELLGISVEELPIYFFNHKLAKTQDRELEYSCEG